MEQLFANFLSFEIFFPQLGADFPDLIVLLFPWVLSGEAPLGDPNFAPPVGCLEGLSALWKGSVQADLDIFLSQFSSTAWKPVPITQAGIKLEGKISASQDAGRRIQDADDFWRSVRKCPGWCSPIPMPPIPFQGNAFAFAWEVLGQGRKAELADLAGGAHGMGNSCGFVQSCWKNGQRVGTAAGLPQVGMLGDAQSPQGSLE